MYKIKLLKDCWGSYSYFGYINNNCHTEGYDTLRELLEDYPAFNNACVELN